MIDFMIFCAKGVAVILGLYLAARIVSAAFFKSKQHYEREKRNEP